MLSAAVKSPLPTFQKATVPELRMVIKYEVEIQELMLGTRPVSRQQYQQIVFGTGSSKTRSLGSAVHSFDVELTIAVIDVQIFESRW